MGCEVAKNIFKMDLARGFEVEMMTLWFWSFGPSDRVFQIGPEFVF